VARATTRATLARVSDERDEREGDGRDDGDERAPTPFDNPFFLPILLWAFTLWFAWDIVTDAEAYRKYPRFNQYGAGACALAALYFTWSAIKERRAKKQDPPD
jgi:hypothetical protein